MTSNSGGTAVSWTLGAYAGTGQTLASSQIEGSDAPVGGRVPTETRRNVGYLVTTFCLLIALTWGGSYAFRLIRAFHVFALLHDKPRPLRVYDRLLGHYSVFRDTSIPGPSGSIDVRIFAPVGRPADRPLVMIHGLAPNGNRDGYLDAVANSLAEEMGYLVVVPTLPAETQYELRPSDVAVITDVIQWTARKTGQKVSVIGASFGAGLAVAAALSPSVVGDVKLIFSLSGYYNLETIARYYMHEPVYDPEGRRYVGDPAGPLFVLSPYLSELVPSDELTALQRELRRELGLHLTDDGSTVVPLTPAEQHDLEQLQAVSTPEVRQRFVTMLARHRQEFAAMSPSASLEHLSVPLYVLHGTNDEVLPSGEIEWMSKDLRGNPNAHIMITPAIGHAHINPSASLWQKFAVAKFGAEILVAMSQSAPLR